MFRTRFLPVLAFFAFLLDANCANDLLKDAHAPPPAAPVDALRVPRPEGARLWCAQDTLPSGSDPAFLFPEGGDGQEVYAPALGTAYVHDGVDAYRRHVNIDLGDGFYVVLSQLDQVFVRSGEPVAAGELLATATCEGSCDHDRLLFGLHAGDASRPASDGVPMPYSFYASAPNGTRQPLATAACSDGTTGYDADLPRNLWHPNGTWIKTPLDSQAYVLEQGRRRPASAAARESFGAPSATVLTVSRDELSCYPLGDALTQPGDAQAAFSSNGALWLFVGAADDPLRWRQLVRPEAWEDVLASWGVSGAGDVGLADAPAFDASLFASYPSRPGYAALRDGTVASEGDTAYVVSDRKAFAFLDADTRRFMGYGALAPVPLEQGTLRALFADVGDCAAGTLCLSEKTLPSCGASWPAGPAASDAAPPPEDAGSAAPTDVESSGGTDADAGSPPAAQDQNGNGAGNDVPPSAQRILRVRWQAPAGMVPDVTTLAGEWRGADGSYKLPWQELIQKSGVDAVAFIAPGAASGDTFRFSVQYAVGGAVSWSCVGVDAAHAAVQGTVTARVDDGPALPVQPVNHATGTPGCDLEVTVP